MGRCNLLIGYRTHSCRNSRCSLAAAEVIEAVFPGTSASPGIPRRRIVVGIVDVSSPKLYNIQQVRFSKLLNLKIPQEGATCAQGGFQRFAKWPIFNLLVSFEMHGAY